MTLSRLVLSLILAAILAAPAFAAATQSGAIELPRPHLFDNDRRTGDSTAPAQADAATQRLLKGLSYLEGDQFDFAVLELDEAIKLKPDYAEALFYRARAHYAGGHIRQAIDDYERVTSLLSYSDRAFYNLGLCYWELDDLPAAKRALTQSLLYNADQPDALRARGRISHREDDVEAAINDFTVAIKLDPDAAATYYFRGTAYLDDGQPAKALEDLDQALRLEPAGSWTILARARAYYDLNRPEDSAREYTAALQQLPDTVFALVRRAQAYEMMRQFDLAMADLDLALSLNPGNASALFGRAAVNMGRGDFAAVVTDLDKVLPNYPESLSVLLARAQALALLGRDQEARAGFDAAVRARPDDGMSFNGRGIMRMALGDLTAAIADLRLASQISPDDAYTAIWHHLAKSKAAGAADRETLGRLQPHRGDSWPGPIAAYLLGDLSADALLARARNAKDYDIPSNLSDAYYVIGARMLRTDVGTARRMFQHARDAKAYFQYSYLATIRELQRLEAP